MHLRLKMTQGSPHVPVGLPWCPETSYSCSSVLVPCPEGSFLPHFYNSEFQTEPDTLSKLLFLAKHVLGDDSSSTHLSPPSSGMSGHSADRVPEGRLLQIKGSHKSQKIVIPEPSTRKGLFPLLCPKITVCSNGLMWVAKGGVFKGSWQCLSNALKIKVKTIGHIPILANDLIITVIIILIQP